MEIDVGRVIAGKYELVRLLGRGSMGEVWAAHHKTLGEQVALKLLTQSPSQDTEVEDPATAAARFQFEAQVAARLSRKTRHIVRVTDHGEEQGLAYLVMELLEGETLEAVLERDGRAPMPIVRGIVAQIARALAQAHGEGVLHRDLKPANVFLGRDEDGELLVKLLDFGIARATHAHRLGPRPAGVTSAFATARGLVFGTPSYMSPEQARASSKLDHRCDLWALAAMAYEAISGELPVPGTETDELIENLCAGRTVPLRERCPEMPAALDAFFGRAFSGAIGARFQTATDLAEAFERAATPAAPSSSRDPGPATLPGEDQEELPAIPRSRGRLVAAAVALVVVLAAIGAWRAFAQSSPPAAVAGPLPRDPSPAPSPALPPPPPPSAVPPQPAPEIALSALPHAHGLARSSALAPARPPGPAPAPEPAPAPAAAPAPPPALAPAPAPVPAPAPKKVDKSEVL